jgi:hypothetical protein
MEHKDFGNSERQYSRDINSIRSHQALLNSLYRILIAVVLPHDFSYVKAGLAVIYAQVQKCTLQKMDKINGFHHFDKTALV